jgi:hypothetical protein
MGPGVKGTINYLLERSKIDKSDISTRFKDFEDVLVKVFGVGGETIMAATLRKLCEEYSLRLDLSYASSHAERLEQLKERIMVDRLVPKHYQKRIETRDFEDGSGSLAPWTG